VVALLPYLRENWPQIKEDRPMAKLYEYAVIHHPKVVKDALGNETQGPDTIIKDVTRVLAGSDKEVAMRAARDIPDTYMTKLEEVEICVRPF
jgi:hypothetical protein